MTANKRYPRNRRRRSKMAKFIQRVYKYRLFAILFAIICLTTLGCRFLPESTFDWRRTHALPKWVVLPSGTTRADVSLRMSYYILPSGRSAKFTLQSHGQQTIEKQNGSLRCKEPLQLKDPPRGSPSGYPAYEAITVGGITEIIEHKKMEPVFYVTDETAVWKQYQSQGCP